MAVGPGSAAMDLSTTLSSAYRYNQNMMEYYTCKTFNSVYFECPLITVLCFYFLFFRPVINRAAPVYFKLNYLLFLRFLSSFH